MLADAQSVRLEGNLQDRVDDSAIAPHLEASNIEILDLIGSDVYTAVSSPDEPWDENDQKSLKRAESLLALSYLIPPLNTSSVGEGGITRSVGFGETRTEYLSQKEVEALAQRYRDRAMDLLAKFTNKQVEDSGETDRVLASDLSIYSV